MQPSPPTPGQVGDPHPEGVTSCLTEPDFPLTIMVDGAMAKGPPGCATQGSGLDSRTREGGRRLPCSTSPGSRRKGEPLA